MNNDLTKCLFVALVFFLLPLHSHAQAKPGFPWIHQTWQGAWENVTRTHTYNDNEGKFQSEVIEKWNNGWEYQSKTEVDYENGKYKTVHEFDYIEGNWTETEKTEYEYNPLGNLARMTGLQFIDGNWENSYRFDYEYDANDNVKKNTGYTWDGSGWIADFRSTYEYDSENRIVLEVLEMSLGEGDWFYLSSDEVDYGPNGFESERRTFIWDLLEEDWLPTTRSLTTYDENDNFDRILYQTWEQTDWADSEQLIHDYNAAGNLAEVLEQGFDGSEWLNIEKDIYRYNASDELIEMLKVIWVGDAQSGAWKNDSRDIREDASAIAESGREDQYTVFPIPASSSIKITYQSNPTATMKVRILDISGKERAASKINSSTGYKMIDLQNLTSGTYFLEIKNGGSAVTRKIIIAR